MKSVALAMMMLFAQLMNTGPYRKRIGIPLNACAVDAWPMNEGSGSTWIDHGSAANNITGITATPPTWTTATGFPGAITNTNATGTATSSAPSTALFTGNSPFTVVYWNNNASQSIPQVFFDTTAGLSAPGLYLRTAGPGDGKFEVVLESGAYPTGAAFLQSSYTPNGTVQYFAVVYNGTSPAGSNFTMYVNGSSVSYSILTNALSSTVTSTHAITLDSNFSNMGYVEVYNCALSGATLASYYGNGPQLN